MKIFAILLSTVMFISCSSNNGIKEEIGQWVNELEQLELEYSLWSETQFKISVSDEDKDKLLKSYLGMTKSELDEKFSNSDIMQQKAEELKLILEKYKKTNPTEEELISMSEFLNTKEKEYKKRVKDTKKAFEAELDSLSK